MSIKFDETLPLEEQNRIFSQAMANSNKIWAEIVYKKAIASGASAEEAAKEASKATIIL